MIKKIVFAATLIASAYSYSFDEISSLPSFFCDEVGCSQYQTKILEQFLKSKKNTVEKEAVYSGKCYHLGQNYDGQYAHHAVIYIVPSQNEMFWSGTFSFFNESNPYRKVTVEEARKQFGEIEKDPYHQFEKKVDYLFKNFGDEEKFFRYWMRLSDNQKHLYVLGFWGLDHRVACDILLNK